MWTKLLCHKEYWRIHIFWIWRWFWLPGFVSFLSAFDHSFQSLRPREMPSGNSSITCYIRLLTRCCQFILAWAYTLSSLNCVKYIIAVHNRETSSYCMLNKGSRFLIVNRLCGRHHNVFLGRHILCSIWHCFFNTTSMINNSFFQRGMCKWLAVDWCQIARKNEMMALQRQIHDTRGRTSCKLLQNAIPHLCTWSSVWIPT